MNVRSVVLLLAGAWLMAAASESAGLAGWIGGAFAVGYGLAGIDR